MLGQRRRRWNNIETTLDQYLTFGGYITSIHQILCVLNSSHFTYFMQRNICIKQHVMLADTTLLMQNQEIKIIGLSSGRVVYKNNTNFFYT